MCSLLSAAEQTALRAPLCKELWLAATLFPGLLAHPQGLHGNGPDKGECKVKTQKTENQKHVVI